jgi:hypothetical protein
MFLAQFSLLCVYCEVLWSLNTIQHFYLLILLIIILFGFGFNASSTRATGRHGQRMILWVVVESVDLLTLNVVIKPNMSLGLIVTNRYVDQSRRLVVVRVNDSSILKGKVFPGDCLFRVQVENEIATVMCWESKSVENFLGGRRGQEKTLFFDPP